MILDVHMMVGDAAKITMPYGFLQIPDCGYEEVVSITGMPSFVTHEEVSKIFVVDPADNADVGTQIVTITSVVKEPIDASMTTFKEWQK